MTDDGGFKLGSAEKGVGPCGICGYTPSAVGHAPDCELALLRARVETLTVGLATAARDAFAHYEQEIIAVNAALDEEHVRAERLRDLCERSVNLGVITARERAQYREAGEAFIRAGLDECQWRDLRILTLDAAVSAFLPTASPVAKGLAGLVVAGVEALDGWRKRSGHDPITIKRESHDFGARVAEPYVDVDLTAHAATQGQEEDLGPPGSCLSCARPEDAANHVPGHVFVGWGQGWQLCPACEGSTRAPIHPPVAPATEEP